MSVVPSALGSVLGYLGAEVAEKSVFERLLWPQRFYNYMDATVFFKLAFLFPTSGPLHRAALEVLDKFRDNGLYRGKQGGEMLGTAFFHDMDEAVYFHRTATSIDEQQHPYYVRNGLWVEVLRGIRPVASERRPGVKARAIQFIYRLHLQFQLDPSENSNVVEEHAITIWTIAGIFCSELSSIILAITAGIIYRPSTHIIPTWNLWIVGFFCIPLFLKLVAMVFTVRREKLRFKHTVGHTPDGDTQTPESEIGLEPVAVKDQATIQKPPQSPEPPNHTEVFEVVRPSTGFMLITVDAPSSDLVGQFFRHYGHPIRSSQYDRAKEIISIILTYCFVLYFPIGLLLLSWMSDPMQYFWLGQQLYCVLALHIIRLFGWEGCGRTEDKIAKMLSRGQKVCLRGENGCVEATLEIEEAESVALARTAVRNFVSEHTNPEPKPQLAEAQS